MTLPLRVGLAGLGVVGGGTLMALLENAATLAARAGRPITVVAAACRDRAKLRTLDLNGVQMVASAQDLATHPGIDVVCELIGGTAGPALDLARATLAAGRHLVTANKAMLAEHGAELAAAAERAGVALAFEAAVAGGIPVVKGLREGLLAHPIARVHGILNGTSNYILTAMRDRGQEFAPVLAEAQALGYAEADPAFDVDGVDAAHKLALLAALAFGSLPDLAGVHVEGIRGVGATDIAYARELGLVIKLLGSARLGPDGLEQRVHPTMVPTNAPIGQVDGVMNGVAIQAPGLGMVMLEGPGAGAGPTASAVVADLVDIARGRIGPAFGLPVASLARHSRVPIAAHRGRYYLRLQVVDRPGVLADVAAVLRDSEVSIETLIQRARDPGRDVPIVLVTHETGEAALTAALAEIAGLPAVLEPPCLIRIESF